MIIFYDVWTIASPGSHWSSRLIAHWSLSFNINSLWTMHFISIAHLFSIKTTSTLEDLREDRLNSCIDKTCVVADPWEFIIKYQMELSAQKSSCLITNTCYRSTMFVTETQKLSHSTSAIELWNLLSILQFSMKKNAGQPHTFFQGRSVLVFVNILKGDIHPKFLLRSRL